MYIESADKVFKEKNWESSYDAKELFDKWFIDFLPTDPQTDEDMTIIYEYNDDLKHYDYKSGNY
jgi:hypothetical protein